MLFEVVGIVGTILILIGFLFNSEKKIRLFNCFGSVFFVVYGILVCAWSTAVLNFIMCIVNIIKLIRGKKSAKSLGGDL